MKNILFVDDEKEILKAIRRAFIDKPYETFFASSGKEALDLLENTPIDLIVSDMRMPEMDGYQLLKTIKARYPKSLRIILSGYSDDTILLKSLKENVAKIYLFKPWNNDELAKIINNLFETEQLLEHNDIFETINNFDTVPTLQSRYLKIIHMIDNSEDTSVVVKEIEKDQALTLNILRIANSAYYNLKALSVFKAVTYLGVNNIRNIVQATAIIDSFVVDKSLVRHMEKVWQCSYENTHLLTLINRKYLKYKEFDVLFTAGLLHRVGEAIMVAVYKGKYIEYLQQSQHMNRIEREALEINLFGHTHNQFGGFILKWWDLPFPVVEAAFYCDTPMLDTIINKNIVKAVYIAEYYAQSRLGMFNKDGLIPGALDDLGINKDVFEQEIAELNMRNED